MRGCFYLEPSLGPSHHAVFGDIPVLHRERNGMRVGTGTGADVVLSLK